MSSLRFAGLLPVLLFAVFGSLGAEPIPKCTRILTFPGIEPGDPVIVVDGAVWDGELVDIDALDVHSIEVICWNPTTGAFEQSVGVPIINILLKPSVAPLRDPLEQLLKAQKAYFANHARYATSIDALDAFDGSGTGVHFMSHSAGWIAKTGSESDPALCEVHLGDGPPEATPNVREGRVDCLPNHAMASLALREAYDAASAPREYREHPGIPEVSGTGEHSTGAGHRRYAPPTSVYPN